MTGRFSLAAVSAALIAVAFALVQLIWIQHLQLSATLALLLAFVGAGAWLFKGSEAPLPLVAADRPSMHPLLGLFGGVALVYAAHVGYQRALLDAWWPLAGAIAAAAVLVRLTRPADLPELGGKAWALILLGLFAVGAVYRFYLIGEIPVGFCGVDEAGIWNRVWLYFNGARSTYDAANLTQGADGMVPIYMQMVGLKAFGGSITGWRMEGALVGTLLIGLTFKVGKDIGGRWVGGVAGFLWAVSLWPMSVSRAHYFISETAFIVMACMAFLTAAFRRGGAWRFVLAGFFWGLSFNTYPAARVMGALVPWFFFLAWYLVPERRKATLAGAWPLLFGFAIAIAPLLLWMRSDPYALRAYFVAFGNVGHQGGNLGGGDLFSRIDLALSRLMVEFPNNFHLLTTRGPVTAYYFPTQYPVLHPALLATAILGVGVCLARFREPMHAFLLYWWMAGMIPAMASANGTVPHDRRSMMLLMPTLLLGALGTVAVLRQFWTFAGGNNALRVLVAVGALGALGYYGQDSWHDYFERNQKDPGLMTAGRANHALLLRALHTELEAHPSLLITSWRAPNDDPYTGGEWGATEPGVTADWFQKYAEHFAKGGLRFSLEAAAAKIAGDKAAKQPARDIVVLLMPFYYYLEPSLQGLGGKLVQTVPLARTNNGLLIGWEASGHPSEFARIYRIPGETFDLAKVSLPGPFQVELSQLAPKALGKDLRTLDQRSEDYRRVTKAYLAGSIKTLRSAHYQLSDPWFWQTDGNLPEGISAPLRLRMKLSLRIDTPGTYAFGASANVLTRLKVDGKLVFDRDAADPKAHLHTDADGLRELRGLVGEPLQLGAGQHTLEIEQAMFSISPDFRLVLRPLWKAPGRGVETLPIEVLGDLPR